MINITIDKLYNNDDNSNNQITPLKTKTTNKNKDTQTRSEWREGRACRTAIRGSVMSNEAFTMTFMRGQRRWRGGVSDMARYYSECVLREWCCLVNRCGIIDGN